MKQIIKGHREGEEEQVKNEVHDSGHAKALHDHFIALDNAG